MNKTNKDYFTFSVHSSALVVGQTGSGKTELVKQYMRRLEKAYTPDELKYIIYDLKQVEFMPESVDGANPDYLYTEVRYGTAIDMEYLEAIAELSEQRTQNNQRKPMIFTYIEECDMAVTYPGRFHAAVKKINQHATKSNMKLIFSTSRPSRNVIPTDFMNSFDLILSGTLASKADEEYLSMSGASTLEPYEFLVREL